MLAAMLYITGIGIRDLLGLKNLGLPGSSLKFQNQLARGFFLTLIGLFMTIICLQDIAEAQQPVITQLDSTYFWLCSNEFANVILLLETRKEKIERRLTFKTPGSKSHIRALMFRDVLTKAINLLNHEGKEVSNDGRRYTL